MNFILDTDSYKLSHFKGYPPAASHIYSYAESRGGVYPATVFFGLQKFVRELAEVRVTHDDIREASEFASMHGVPFNEDGWKIIYNQYRGRIPVRIKAVAEGTLVPTSNVLVTVENIDPTMPWLTSYVETALLRSIWYPTTVATRIHYMKEKIKHFYDVTSDNGDMGFALLDFSARGCSSRETAEVGGLAHLVSFMGSDNIPAVLAARRFYDEPMAAFSVAATEHSVTTSWGHTDETASIEHMIENMMPENGILSLVGDTWNIYEFVEKVAQFQDKIRNKNGTLVIRPDSGAMRDVLPQVMNEAARLFGETRNSKGYGVLNNVKILQGDGINENSVTVPFAIAESLKISADSIMTGSGGGLMQANIDRDTCKFAFKASNVTIDGHNIGIAKEPITDPGKRSKRGRLMLLQNALGEFTTMTNQDARYSEMDDMDILNTVYLNGELFNQETLGVIRERANKSLR